MVLKDTVPRTAYTALVMGPDLAVVNMCATFIGFDSVSHQKEVWPEGLHSGPLWDKLFFSH